MIDIDSFELGFLTGRAKATAEGSKAVLPHPCDGPLYADWDFPQYADKLDEEIEEFFDALIDWESGKGTLDDLGGELTDVIIVSTSFLNALGFDLAARQELMRQKNQSNSERDDGMRFAQPPKAPAKAKKKDKINHPDYYNHGIECIDYIQSHDFDFCLGNAIKYITRAGYKTDDTREDLKKAIRYLEFEIEDIEKKEGDGNA